MCGNTALYNIWDTRFVFAGMLEIEMKDATL